MPISEDDLQNVRLNLTQLSAGEKPVMVVVGSLTDAQFNAVNAVRRQLGLHEIEQNEIVFIGRHLYNSRSADGYTVEDMVDQVASALSALSVAEVSVKMTCIQNPAARPDRYGNQVRDRAVFEATSKKPRMELFSVIPKGDNIKPLK